MLSHQRLKILKDRAITVDVKIQKITTVDIHSDYEALSRNKELKQVCELKS